MNQATQVWVFIFFLIAVFCIISFFEKLSKSAKYVFSAYFALVLGLAALSSGLSRYFSHDDGLRGSRRPSAWYQDVAVGAMALTGAGFLYYASKKEK